MYYLGIKRSDKTKVPIQVQALLPPQTLGPILFHVGVREMQSSPSEKLPHHAFHLAVHVPLDFELLPVLLS